MAKFLKQILGDDYAEAVYPRLPNNDRDAKNHWKQNSPDAQRFVDKHAVHNFLDRNGNGDDVFNASNIETVERAEGRHGYNLGYNNPQDEDINEDVKKEFPVGYRVQAHPATDRWMRGDRYGEVVGHGKKKGTGLVWVDVKMDRSGEVTSFHPDNIQHIKEDEDINEDVKKELNFQTDPIDKQTKAYGKSGRYKITPTESGHQLSYYSHNDRRVGFAKQLGHFPSHALARSAAYNHESSLREEIEEYDPELLLDEILSEMEKEDVERVIQIMENGTDEEIEQLADFLTEISKEDDEVEDDKKIDNLDDFITEISKDMAYRYLRKTAGENYRPGREGYGPSRQFYISKTESDRDKDRTKGIHRAIDRLAGLRKTNVYKPITG